MAEQKKQAVDKKQVLQDFLTLAKKNGEVKIEAIERLNHLLELSTEQQGRICETLDKLKVKVIGIEEPLPEARTEVIEEPEPIKEQKPQRKNVHCRKFWITRRVQAWSIMRAFCGICALWNWMHSSRSRYVKG